MYYCEGTNCSRRDQCAYHEAFDWKYPRQYLDQSTEGTTLAGKDDNGNSYVKSIWNCGDNAWYYGCYKALGWREGQEYKNSIGLKYDDVCVNCEHRSLCFMLLEDAGLITRPAKRIALYCEKIKTNPEEYRKWLIENGWREELL